uniref:Uncharacterized protein n=1 Tax=Candidatus Methanomethylicus mesodigestus TaxID=1867258 RepID=A0A7C3F0P6_9CREN
MNPAKISTLTRVFLLAQLRVRGGGTGEGLFRRPSSLALIYSAVFVLAFAFIYFITGVVPSEDLAPIEAIGIQILALVPLIVFIFMVTYGIFFVIGEASQHITSEAVNYMPVTAGEYVIASTVSTAFMHLWILTGALGVSLGFGLRFGLLAGWAASAVLSLLFMVIGGAVAEIIRAIVNRVSSSFSKRGGRAAIFSRAVLIIVVLVVSQAIFNPNILFMVISSFAPQALALWFVPLMWPSIIVASVAAGDAFGAAVFSALTLAFGGILIYAGVFFRSKYWVPLPATIRIGGGSGKPAKYQGKGFLGALGFSAQEGAIMRKDLKALLRRKEMVRFWAMPIVMVVPLVATAWTAGGDVKDLLGIAAMMSLIGSGFFGMFIASSAIGQEGKGIWRIFTSPVSSESILKAKIALPLMLTLPVAALFPLGISAFLNFSQRASFAIFLVTLLGAVVCVLVGAYFGLKYPDISENMRGNFVTGTGILLSFAVCGGLCALISAPFAVYAVFHEAAVAAGLNYCASAAITAAAGVALIGALSVLTIRKSHALSIMLSE